MSRAGITPFFPHKPNLDGSIDSICPNCFGTVASSTVESELGTLEEAHTCAGFRLGRLLYSTGVPVVKPVFYPSPSGFTIDLRAEGQKVKIQVTWNKPDGTKPAVELRVNPNDPQKDDEELQIKKAVIVAGAHFKEKFGDSPMSHQLTAKIIRE